MKKLFDVTKHKKIHILAVKILQSKFLYILKNFRKNTDGLFNKLAIETTSICNRNCSFCPVSINRKSKTRKEGLMDIDLFKKIVVELKELNYHETICLMNYGEPLLDKRLDSMTKEINDTIKPKEILLNTNGDYLTREKFELGLKSGITTYIVSQYDNPPKNEFSKLYPTLTSEELKHIIYENKNEDTIGFYNRGGTVNLKYDLHTYSCNPLMVIIRHNGDVCVCCNDFFNVINFGNVKDKKLIDIWNSEEYRKFRREIKFGKFSYDICKKCVGEI